MSRLKININKDELWFTSDLHFFHSNIIGYCGRPWDNQEEMNEGIIKNWNSVVQKHHKVFILGDVAMGGKNKASHLASILARLNGIKYMVPGNHDTYILNSPECLEHITVLPPLCELKVPDPDTKGGQRIVLCHYAMKVWNRSHHGTWMLYGHSHHTMPPDYSIKSLDVGLDGKGYDYKPLTYDQVKNLMSSHGSDVVDHHSRKTN